MLDMLGLNEYLLIGMKFSCMVSHSKPTLNIVEIAFIFTGVKHNVYITTQWLANSVFQCARN